MPPRRDAVTGAAALSDAPPNAPAGVPPDLGSMTPRERFDRLYNRVMAAAEAGNAAEVARFSPMAFAAYGQLDSADADARYHAAVLYLHVASDTAAALRLADSIAIEAPRHLFAMLIRGTAARQSGNAPLLARSQREFLAAWAEEIQGNRPEYRDHRTSLDEFRDTALREAAGRTPVGQ
jgi:hypothetical protein